jgi:hypothetical protein
LSAIQKPTMSKGHLMTTKDGGLGFATVDGTSLTLWARETHPKSAVGWSKLRVIDLKMVLPDGALENRSLSVPLFVNVSGFADEFPL